MTKSARNVEKGEVGMGAPGIHVQDHPKKAFLEETRTNLSVPLYEFLDALL